MAMTKATGPVRAYFNMGTTVESCATCRRSCKREDGVSCYYNYTPDRSSSDPLWFARAERDAEAAFEAYIDQWEQDWADAEYRP
jgi:hypothetical protein